MVIKTPGLESNERKREIVSSAVCLREFDVLPFLFVCLGYVFVLVFFRWLSPEESPELPICRYRGDASLSEPDEAGFESVEAEKEMPA